MFKKEGECLVQRTRSGFLKPRGGFREDDVRLLNGIVEPSWKEARHSEPDCRALFLSFQAFGGTIDVVHWRDLHPVKLASDLVLRPHFATSCQLGFFSPVYVTWT